MTPDQIKLVQSSWALVVPIAGPAADIFYDKLFALDPALRSLFPDDLVEQKKKLMAMIGRVVASLDKLDTIVDAVVALGERHVGYGVTPEMYDTVGAALLDTLATGLGDGFTVEVKDAWATAYGILAGAMTTAPAEAASA